MKLRQMRLKTEAGDSCKDGGAGLLYQLRAPALR